MVDPEKVAETLESHGAEGMIALLEATPEEEEDKDEDEEDAVEEQDCPVEPSRSQPDSKTEALMERSRSEAARDEFSRQLTEDAKRQQAEKAGAALAGMKAEAKLATTQDLTKVLNEFFREEQGNIETRRAQLEMWRRMTLASESMRISSRSDDGECFELAHRMEREASMQDITDVMCVRAFGECLDTLVNEGNAVSVKRFMLEVPIDDQWNAMCGMEEWQTDLQRKQMEKKFNKIIPPKVFAGLIKQDAKLKDLVARLMKREVQRSMKRMCGGGRKSK